VPNRIAHVRVGEETRLVEVLVELIGLEPLRLLGEHVTALCHGNKNFVGFPKKADIESARIAAQTKVGVLMASDVARGQLPWSSVSAARDDPKFSERAGQVRDALQTKKSELFSGVSVAPSLDLSRPEDVNKVQRAAAEASALLGESLLRNLPSMAAISQIGVLSKPASLQAAQAAVTSAQAALEAARSARNRQLKDSRLRLKVLAARWHAEHHPDTGTVDECPLCDRPFEAAVGAGGLSAELASLRQEGEDVTRSFDDSCRIIEVTLSDAMTACGCAAALPGSPVRCLLDELAKALEDSVPMGMILSAARDQAVGRIRATAAGLPEPPPSVGKIDGTAAEKRLLTAVAGAENSIRLALVWPEAQPVLTKARGSSRQERVRWRLRAGNPAALTRCRDAGCGQGRAD
jgi:hypothetical protein